jgi:hypothetical protein
MTDFLIFHTLLLRFYCNLEFFELNLWPDLSLLYRAAFWNLKLVIHQQMHYLLHFNFI